MEDGGFVKELLSELELRIEHCRINKSESNHFTHSDKDKKKTIGELNTASALLAKMNHFCGYCNGGHAHHDCTIVKSVAERRQLLHKYGRCFVCACKGHISRDCKSKVTCSISKGKHHVSICYKCHSTNRGQFSRAHNVDYDVLLDSDHASNACPAHTGKSRGKDAPIARQAVTSPTFHVGAEGRVAYKLRKQLSRVPMTI